MQKRAIFLDRDGTMIEDAGYSKSSADIIFFYNVFAALKILHKDFLLFIITNQSGIGNGFLSLEDVKKVNQSIVDRLNKELIRIEKKFVCPHRIEDHCHCRKRNPYFLQQASKEYNIDLSRSYLIGDHPEDVYCAENAGATGIYLLTGHGMKHLNEFDEKPAIQADIFHAARFIKSQINEISNERHI